MRSKGFLKGYRQSDKKKIRLEIMGALGIKKVSFYYYLKGAIEPKASQADKIEEIFQNYGITEIWGE